MTKPKYYITTAIAYASAKPHIGNTYEAIATDAIARYKRAKGYDVFFCTGTDEHGQKIENCAAAAGIAPQAYVDNVAGVIKGMWDKMNVSYDYFIRTTDDYHVKTIQKIFERFLRQGDIYKGYYEGWYCTPCESFFTDTQVTDGKCPDCGRPVKQAKEEAYFFNMQKYAPRLIEYFETHPGFLEPEARKKEMLNNFLLSGLQDLCVSRTSFTWGIQVPSDPKHVVYVWLDALVNYITAIGYDPDKSFEEQSEQFKKLWPADVHMIGKDIVRFHSIYWPIFLMALDLPLPEKIFGHPWFNFGADKMSKSRGNVIYADKLSEYVGVDGVRYYALAEMPFASDGSITWESVLARYNTDLVNTLGNLVKRTLDMQKKYFDKKIEAPTAPEALDDDFKAVCAEAVKTYYEAMDSYHIADAIDAILSLLRRANKYIDETQPWVLAKNEESRARLATVLYNLLESIRWGAVMLAPMIPETAATIFAQLGTENTSFESIGGEFNGTEAGASVNDSAVLFARIDEAKTLEGIYAEIEAARKAAEAPKIEKPEGCAIIGFDDFMKVELRTAQITECEPVPKAKKLLKLKVDLGYETRQVVSGIAKFYKPEDLIGKKIILVANLAPAKLCGVESEGMLLASGEETVRVIFLDPETPLGERVR
ncbi:MAG: methionine--tRNA ligase [Clostridia bacterium]|nr:methionine--tRNA ligase [Clostridia bacterium]MBR4062377.1 methionine--tRNA ligase [Clostridia bacterium]